MVDSGAFQKNLLCRITSQASMIPKKLSESINRRDFCRESVVVTQLSLRAFWTHCVHLSSVLVVLPGLSLVSECIQVIYLTCCTEILVYSICSIFGLFLNIYFTYPLLDFFWCLLLITVSPQDCDFIQQLKINVIDFPRRRRFFRIVYTINLNEPRSI